MGTSINDVPPFLAIFDLPTYLVLLYYVPFGILPYYRTSLMDFPYLEFTLDLPNMYIQTNVCYINGKKDEEFLGFNVLDYGKRLGIPPKEKKSFEKNI